MLTRRQLFIRLFAAIILAPLVRLGWIKAPVEDLGISIRYISKYDASHGLWLNRMDVLYGAHVPNQTGFRCVIES